MCNSVEQVLKQEFGFTLASPEVVILDPCTGTGNFIVNLIERIPGKALANAYHNRLFANEVMLLPYYVASLNIEHAYYERMKQYESFEGLCFADTLDMADAQQRGLLRRRIPREWIGRRKRPLLSSSATRLITSGREAKTTTTRTENIRKWTSKSGTRTQKILKRQTKILCPTCK